MAFDDPCKVRIKMCRLSYPALFKPKGFGKKQEGEKKFQAVAIIDPETKAGRQAIRACEAAIAAAKEAKWGSKPPKLKADKIALREGDPDAEETDGMMVVSSSNTKKPLTLDENGDECTEADDVLYGGCYVDMIVRFWAQDNEYGTRINASLEGVKFREDGEPFSSGSRTTADDFDDDDDDEDERPKSKRRSRDDDDDEDERPKSKRRSRDDDDDEDERPKSKRRPSRDDDDDEDERPKSKRRSRDEDDDEDERPKSKRRSRDDDDDDEDEKPKSKRRSPRDDDDEDEEPKSKRRRKTRDEDDDY